VTVRQSPFWVAMATAGCGALFALERLALWMESRGSDDLEKQSDDEGDEGSERGETP